MGRKRQQESIGTRRRQRQCAYIGKTPFFDASRKRTCNKEESENCLQRLWGPRDTTDGRPQTVEEGRTSKTWEGQVNCDKGEMQQEGIETHCTGEITDVEENAQTSDGQCSKRAPNLFAAPPALQQFTAHYSGEGHGTFPNP